jgi:hypothetical protein|tara:strand:+ start:224 stop:412 length:189 start_codon:yes stop_codon:yes gene_type:complete
MKPRFKFDKMHSRRTTVRKDRLDRLKSFVMDTNDPWEAHSDEAPPELGLIFKAALKGGKHES